MQTPATLPLNDFHGPAMADRPRPLGGGRGLFVYGAAAQGAGAVSRAVAGARDRAAGEAQGRGAAGGGGLGAAGDAAGAAGGGGAANEVKRRRGGARADRGGPRREHVGPGEATAAVCRDGGSS